MGLANAKAAKVRATRDLEKSMMTVENEEDED
jgi:hypothetical protein